MKRFLFFMLVTLFCTSASVQAEQKKQLGNWDVHYMAFAAPMLTPEIAQQYKIQRSKYNAVVNISVLGSKTQQPEKVLISGIAKDIQGRQVELDFREVTEGAAVYYLAQLPFRNEQRFNFSITLVQNGEQQLLNFDQTFYVD